VTLVHGAPDGGGVTLVRGSKLMRVAEFVRGAADGDSGDGNGTRLPAPCPVGDDGGAAAGIVRLIWGASDGSITEWPESANGSSVEVAAGAVPRESLVLACWFQLGRIAASSGEQRPRTQGVLSARS